MRPTIERVAGVWGTLVRAACPRCDWHGRKRDPNRIFSTPQTVKDICFAEGVAHLNRRHSKPADPLLCEPYIDYLSGEAS